MTIIVLASLLTVLFFGFRFREDDDTAPNKGDTHEQCKISKPKK